MTCGRRSRSSDRVCALVRSANPSLTAQEVKALLQATADKTLSFQTDTPVNERGEFDANGFSLWFGNGKVNAFHAVQQAAGGGDAGQQGGDSGKAQDDDVVDADFKEVKDAK